MRRAIRAFFLWGRAFYKGNLITTTAELAGTFDSEIIREVRLQVAHLRQYWVGLEGTGTTHDDTMAELCRYHQDLVNEIEQRRKELNQEEWIEIAREELAALEQQLMEIRNAQYPTYSFFFEHGLKSQARTGRPGLNSLP